MATMITPGTIAEITTSHIAFAKSSKNVGHNVEHVGNFAGAAKDPRASCSRVKRPNHVVVKLFTGFCILKCRNTRP